MAIPSTSDPLKNSNACSNPTIKKTNKGYEVLSKTHKRPMGTYTTKAEAIKRLMQVEMFKAMKKAGTLRKSK